MHSTSFDAHASHVSYVFIRATHLYLVASGLIPLCRSASEDCLALPMPPSHPLRTRHTDQQIVKQFNRRREEVGDAQGKVSHSRHTIA